MKTTKNPINEKYLTRCPTSQQGNNVPLATSPRFSMATSPLRERLSPLRERFLFVGFRPKWNLPSLSSLLENRDFDTIYDILNDPTKDTSKWFTSTCCVTGENCLHAILRLRPPAKLVKLLLQQLSEYGIEEPELSVDDIGRTPLHFAVGYSCEPEIIKILVTTPAGRMSTRAQDCSGRIPLHLAMVPYSLIDKGKLCVVAPFCSKLVKSFSEFRTIMRLTVAILVAASPMTINVRDDKYMTPLDIAKPLEFDPYFLDWVEYVSKLGGTVRTQEEIAMQRDMANQIMSQEILSATSPSTIPPRHSMRSKNKKNRRGTAESIWSIDAMSVY